MHPRQWLSKSFHLKHDILYLNPFHQRCCSTMDGGVGSRPWILPTEDILWILLTFIKKNKNLAIILMNGKMWVFLPLRAFICLYFLFHFYCSCRVFWGVGLFALAFKASMCLHMHRNTRQSLVVPIGKQILSSVPINAADFFLFFMFMDIFCSWWPIPLPNQSSCSQIFL